MQKYYALATSQDSKSQDVDLKYINQPELDLQQELTKFENDDNVITQTEPAPDVINPPEATVHTDMRDHSIISFLQRPQILYESSIASGSRSQILQDFRVPEALFNSMIVDKLRGFTSFKATAVIRVQLQSQPFMCGRLLLSAIPMPDLIATRSDFISSNVSRLMLLNNVQADVAKDTDMELKIPFISPYTCYDLISSRWSWSRVVLSLYSPINTIGNLPLDYIVYGHFENIELGAPTSGDFGQFKAQGGIGTQKKLGKSDVSRTQTIEKRPTTISGKLSGIAAGVSGVSDNLGSLLPFLNPVTSVVSGISNTIGSGIASLGKLLGFSKVLNPVFPVEVVNRAVVNFATTDSVDVSQSLSLMRDVNVPPIAGLTGTQTDELSFDFLKKIPQFIDSFSFSNNTVVGNSIWQIAVHPSLLLKGSSIAFSSRIFDSDFDIKTKVYPTPIPQVTHLSYICSPFKYWKGSLTYTFKFVKTDFHSGRVEISYHPFTNYTDQINRSDYVYRVIVDLREKSEVSVCIPFFSQSPFKRVSVPLDISAQYSKYAFYSTGTLVVKALTPLKYSAVVSNTIECLVEISAGDDFEVSCPNESKIIPFAFDKYLPTPVFKAESGFLSAAHQLNPRQEAIEQKESSITGNELDVSSTSLQRELNGEVFVNYRSFIKRNSWYSKIKFVANPSGEVFSESIPVRDLIAAPILRGGLLTYLYDNNAVNLDKAQYLAMYVLNMRPTPLSFVSGMYAFHRGGIRVKTYSFDGVNSIALKYVTYSEDDSDPVTQSLQFNSPQGVEQTSLKIIGEFQVPYYGLSFMASHYKDTESFFISRPRNRVKIVSDTGKPVSVAVSGADDLDFMVFLGTPPSLTTKFASGGKNVSYVKKGDPDINATGFLPSLRFGDSAVNADPWFRIIQEEDPQGNNIFIQPEYQKAVYLNDYVFK